MKVHGIISSYFGNHDWDLDLCARRLDLFADSLYLVLDSRGGNPRGYAQLHESFMRTGTDLKFGYLPAHSFFSPEGASDWRKNSFAMASEVSGYEDDDWVMFVDGTEGLSLDASVLPPGSDWDDLDQASIFQYQVLAEIAAAGSAEVIWLPYWVYVISSQPYVRIEVADLELESVLDANTTGIYQGVPVADVRSLNRSTTIHSQQFYARPGKLARLIKVSALRDPAFDWSILDTFEETAPIGVDASIGCSLVSYTYAQWAKSPNLVDMGTKLPAEERWDIGFSMRKAISKVRPVENLPHLYWPPDDLLVDLYYMPHPHPPDGSSLVNAEGPDFELRGFSSDFLAFQRDEVDIEPDWAEEWPAGEIPLSYPLYQEIVRENPMLHSYIPYGSYVDPPWNYFSGLPEVGSADWLAGVGGGAGKSGKVIDYSEPILR